MGHPKAACPECGAACLTTAARCRACKDRAKTATARARRACLDCGALTSRAGTRCASCHTRSRQHDYHCQSCGGPVSNYRAIWCEACHVARKQERTTCTCGRRKSYGNAHCRSCDQAIRISRHGDWHDIVMTFNPAAFRRELERADLDWSIRQLSDASGVGTSAINQWLAGEARPRRPELEAVLDVLAFERCGACNGLGRVDPSQPHRQAMEGRVTSTTTRGTPNLRVAPPPPGPLRVGSLVVDTATRTVSLGDQSAELSLSEAAILTALASTPDFLRTSEEIARLAQLPTAATVRQHISRIRPKLKRIGASAYLVTGTGSGTALSARCESRDRRTA